MKRMKTMKALLYGSSCRFRLSSSSGFPCRWSRNWTSPGADPSTSLRFAQEDRLEEENFWLTLRAALP